MSIHNRRTVAVGLSLSHECQAFPVCVVETSPQLKIVLPHVNTGTDIWYEQVC